MKKQWKSFDEVLRELYRSKPDVFASAPIPSESARIAMKANLCRSFDARENILEQFMTTGIFGPVVLEIFASSWVAMKCFGLKDSSEGKLIVKSLLGFSRWLLSRTPGYYHCFGLRGLRKPAVKWAQDLTPEFLNKISLEDIEQALVLIPRDMPNPRAAILRLRLKQAIFDTISSIIRRPCVRSIDSSTANSEGVMIILNKHPVTRTVLPQSSRKKSGADE